MNRSAISTATLSKPPGIAPEIEHQHLHALADECARRAWSISSAEVF